MTTPRMIDADGHVIEQLDLDPDVSAAFFDRLNGELPIRVFGPDDDPIPDEASHAELMYRPGGSQPRPRLQDMDADGIDVSVVYPTLVTFIYLEQDRDLARACMVAYNDWMLEDFQGADPRRLVGLPMLPVDDDVDVCVQEFERVVAKGAKAVFVPGFPVEPYHDPRYEPLWSAAEDAGVPVTFHRTFGGRSQEPDWDGGRNNFSAAGTVARFFSGVRPLTYMIFAGVFDRHPGLVLVGAEINCGWVPFWAQTMDQQAYNQQALQDMPSGKAPSDCLGTNVFVTVLDDDIGFRLMAEGEPHLAEACMFSTDYPHSVTLWPNSRSHIARLTKGMSDHDPEKVLSGNAARVYHV